MSADDVPLIPREVLFGNPERVSPALSPDGLRLGWLAPAEGVLNVWVAPVDDLAAATVVTEDRDRGIHGFSWAHDGATLLYVQDRGGDENWRVYGVDVASASTRDLTPFEGVQARLVALDKRHPERVLLGLNRDNPQLHDVYSLELASGELTKVADNPGFIGWVADADFDVRAALAPTPDGGTVLLVRVAGSAGDDWRPLLTAGPEDALTTAPLAFSADGSSLLAISSVGADTGRLVRLDVATGDLLEVLAADPGADVADVELHPDTREVQAVSFVKARTELVVLDAAIAGDVDALGALAHGDLHLISRDDADHRWLSAHVPDDGPIVYHLWDRARREARRLFTHQPALEAYELASMEPFSMTARDGLTLHGYVTWPTTVAAGARHDLPAVLLVHGGPWARDRWGFNAEAQWLANRGYLCLQVNFRGSTGYGKAFVNAGDREWGGRMHDDLVDAVRWAVGHGYADPARVAIFGGSYGGYAALVGAAFTPSVFAAAVDIVGPSNLITLIRSIPPYWAPLLAQFHNRVGNPDTEEEFLWSRSPLSRAADITVPLIIAQGANDPRVKQAESEQIVAALVAAGVDHQYLLFSDEGHGFAKPENRLCFYSAAEEFLARHLGGRAEP
ncbi:MAG TPA: S9 family peptidase [Acidimicrobiales bacterium]|nr:S9 family peptidase [Acidimicrobiales bacterium]